jgi:hypothetical protein
MGHYPLRMVESFDNVVRDVDFVANSVGMAIRRIQHEGYRKNAYRANRVLDDVVGKGGSVRSREINASTTFGNPIAVNDYVFAAGQLDCSFLHVFYSAVGNA